MSQTPWLDIYLLCHNRPDGAREAMASILAQRGGGFRLIVSDNSTDDTVASMAAREFPLVEIRKRGGLPPFEHFNRCIAEAFDNAEQTPWFCLFHDDDIMTPDFVAGLGAAVQRFPDAAAIGVNAWVVNQSNGSREVGVRGRGDYTVLRTPHDLFQRYFGRHQTGIAPFPGYIYRAAEAGRDRMPLEGGKYSDVTWLLSLAAHGRLVWVNRPLMEYRLHGGNDGLRESLRDRLRFLGVLKHHPEWCGTSGLVDYRYFLYRKCLELAGSNVRVARRRRWLQRQLARLRRERLLRATDWPSWWRKHLLHWTTPRQS